MPALSALCLLALGSASANPSTQSVVVQSVTDGASFAGNVSPGSLATVFGTNLAAASASASAVPLPTTLGDVTVAVNGQAVPLLYVSALQINFQLPYQTPLGHASVVVNNGSVSSARFLFNVTAAAPGIFSSPTGAPHAAAVNPGVAANDPGHPAAPGSVITVYLTGQGPLDNPVPTGAAAPLTPVSKATLPFSATIAGQDAFVQFLGLTPDYVGLAQANVVVPSGLTNGDYPLVITVGSVASKAATISVGISSGVGPVSRLVADFNTPRPDGTSSFTPVFSHPPALENGVAVFDNGDSIWSVNVDTGAFTKLVDLNTPVPNGSGSFSSFYYNDDTAFATSPQIRNGIVIFWGADATHSGGFYSVPATGGAVARVANYNTADLQGGFFNTNLDPTALEAFYFDGSTVAFDSSGSTYTTHPDGSNLTLFAGQSTFLCSADASLFQAPFLSPSVSGNQVAVVAGAGIDFAVGQNAIFTGPIAGLASDPQPCSQPYVPHPSNVTSTEQLPGNSDSGYHTRIGTAILDGTTIYFAADDSYGTYDGIFSADSTVAGAGGGPITHLFDNVSSGLTGYFDNFNQFSEDQGSIAFDAVDSSNRRNYYLLSGGSPIQLTNNPTTDPFNSLQGLNPHALSNGRLVFIAGGSGYAAIYLVSSKVPAGEATAQARHANIGNHNNKAVKSSQ